MDKIIVNGNIDGKKYIKIYIKSRNKSLSFDDTIIILENHISNIFKDEYNNRIMNKTLSDYEYICAFNQILKNIDTLEVFVDAKLILTPIEKGIVILDLSILFKDIAFEKY